MKLITFTDAGNTRIGLQIDCINGRYKWASDIVIDFCHAEYVQWRIFFHLIMTMDQLTQFFLQGFKFTGL